MDSSNPETSFSLRQARMDDAGAVHDLSRQLAVALGDSEPRRDEIRDRLQELLGELRAQVLVVEMENRVVGVATLWIKPDLAHGDTVVELPTLVVDQEFRGLGAGTLLMRGVRDIAREHGASLIELVATQNNASAMGFYRSLGFVRTDHITLELVGEPPTE